ncbi:MAG: deaminase [Candidatus Methanomethylophilaceae archaeon]
MRAEDLSEGEHVISGYISDRRGIRRGHAVVEDGVVVSVSEGEAKDADYMAVMVMDIVNGHTHCADYGLKVPPGIGLEELVAPPNGLKHRYLRESPDDVLVGSMVSFSVDSASHGTDYFVDFREGGYEGCRMLRRASPDALILGRPVSPVFDPEEVSAILDIADGIGIPSISDMPFDYIEAVADEVRSRRKIFSIHVSERVREDIDAVLSLDPAFVVHMCEATDDDLLKCAEAEVPVVVCPRSNAYFGKEAPVARMRSCGVDICLGTDNGMLASPDMLAEASAMLGLIEAQGGEPDDVWSTLSSVLAKLLNRQKEIIHPTVAGRMAVMPLKGDDPSSSLRGYRGDGFGLDIKGV